MSKKQKQRKKVRSKKRKQQKSKGPVQETTPDKSLSNELLTENNKIEQQDVPEVHENRQDETDWVKSDKVETVKVFNDKPSKTTEPAIQLSNTATSIIEESTPSNPITEDTESTPDSNITLKASEPVPDDTPKANKIIIQPVNTTASIIEDQLPSMPMEGTPNAKATQQVLGDTPKVNIATFPPSNATTSVIEASNSLTNDTTNTTDIVITDFSKSTESATITDTPKTNESGTAIPESNPLKSLTKKDSISTTDGNGTLEANESSVINETIGASINNLSLGNEEMISIITGSSCNRSLNHTTETIYNPSTSQDYASVATGTTNNNLDSSQILKPIRDEFIQDASTDIAGFVAGELEEIEEEAREAREGEEGEALITSTASYGTLPIEPSVEMSNMKMNIIMCSMYLGVFLAALDNTVVSTLMAHIGSEFNQIPKVPWVATSYLLSSAVFQPLYGKLSDIFGRKALLIFSNLIFFFGCIICGMSNSLNMLVWGRFVAGIGGGGITSMTTITVSDIVPLRSRAVYQGICNFFFGLGTAFGGVIGGIFVDHQYGWRMVFWSQVPVSGLSTLLICSFLVVPRIKNYEVSLGRKLMRVDWLGSISMILWLTSFLLITTMMGGISLDIDSDQFHYLIMFSSVSAIIFVLTELFVASDPVLPLRFLSNRSVLGASLGNFFCVMGFMTICFYLPIYFASVLDISPTGIGKRMAPNFLCTALGSLGAGVYMKQTGKYYWFVVLFALVSTLGHYYLTLIPLTVSITVQYLLVVLPGVGSSIIIVVALLAMIAAVPHKHQAATTSISYAFRSTGGTLGVALGSSVFHRTLIKRLHTDVLEYVSPEHPRKELLRIIKKASHSTEWVHRKAPTFIRDTLITCYDVACHDVFVFCTACALLAAISLALIREERLATGLRAT
ncbi:hypothetical protein TBLA_0F03040 [Henningerozyma blattae CBS 6284]|uniref:Major facilitator superfamily (MFS) profile domain-containing protein n=1 Tax=Henningerozyma blattae (strain ATCC 34711 / CBS 6284 / DSM 70876 / NBRC 10599 / NRRL Y-10934 / UCD 77-7) TaxID=1071380 RepID=I2H641_HENB6|nr:hypothetical protein TBLA_0F03040 [Tetrapisispora blattae CBS 6284]CCH61843.1 hypothetical protein TBLA_0F03040 [Tetrapisispora blattae CBS 6284]